MSALTSTARADDAVVTAAQTTARTAPFDVAPVKQVLGRGTRLEVGAAPTDGWRFAVLPGGAQGYVRDADVTLVAGAAGPATSATTASAATETETTTESYAGQMALIYVPSVVLYGLGAASRSPGAATVGALGLFLGPPILHVGEGHGSAGAASLGLRALALGTSIAFVDDCLRIQLFGGQSSTDGSPQCTALAIAVLAEAIALPVLDFAMATKTVRRTSGLGLVVAPAPSAHGLALSVGGRF